MLPLETFTLVWSVVLLCLLFPYPACIRYKVRPAWLVGGDIGRKFALRGQNAPNWAILGEQGEFCPAHAVRRGVQGEFCSSAAQSVCPGAELPPPTGTAAIPAGAVAEPTKLLWRSSHRLRWGFCSIRSWLAACRRRVVALMTPFPRLVTARLVLRHSHRRHLVYRRA